MFTKKNPVEKTALETEIDSVLKQMGALEADATEYAKMVEQLQKLYALQPQKKGCGAGADAKLAVAGNLIGIVLILAYERGHVIATKALSFVIKPKV